MLSVAVNTKNQISEAGFVYDAAGNLVQTPAPGALVMAYDAENRMTAAAGVTYSYDGDGKRLGKDTDSDGILDKIYWYGMSADALVETDSTGANPTEYVFFGGKRIARRDPNGSVFYFFADHLGSSRVVTNATGQILDDSDFYPFGGERAIVNNDPNPYKFTGKERDAESGLDYFIARYYSSSYGRFNTADPLLVKKGWLVDPQRFNRYSYARNNPLNMSDPDGLDATVIYSVGNLTEEQRKWFEANKQKIFDAIKKKLNDAGIKNVVFKDVRTLSKTDLEKLDAAPVQQDRGMTGIPGVVRVEFTGDTAWAANELGEARHNVLEYTDRGRVAVYLDRIIGKNASEHGTDPCDAVCGVANVAAHGIGHAFGFKAPGHNWFGISAPWHWFRADVMKYGQDPFSKPLPYVREPNLKAIEEVDKAKPFPE